MPEVISTLVAQSGLPSGGRVFSDFLKLAVLPNRNILQLRLGARSVKTIASLRIAGRTVPAAMNSWSGDDPAFCRIAPDLWLLQSALHEANDLEQAVRAGCGKRSFAVTNVSDACATLVLEGSLAASLLARGCAIDFSLNAFGTAACSRTRLAQLPVVLRRMTFERFECLVDRSAAQYLYEWIEDAVTGLE
jgi:heterotetrameric sarcosine oxidase gamma subunit